MLIGALFGHAKTANQIWLSSTARDAHAGIARQGGHMISHKGLDVNLAIDRVADDEKRFIRLRLKMSCSQCGAERTPLAANVDRRRRRLEINVAVTHCLHSKQSRHPVRRGPVLSRRSVGRSAGWLRAFFVCYVRSLHSERSYSCVCASTYNTTGRKEKEKEWIAGTICTYVCS